MSKTQNVVTKTAKVTTKQLQEAENAYIVAHSDMIHKIVSQDYSGRKMTAKDNKEREQYIDKFRQQILNLNTVSVKFLYEQMQALMKKSKQDAVRLYCHIDESEITIEYDYFTVQKQGDEVTYVPSETNEIVESFFRDIPEQVSNIVIDMSYKMLTEDGAIYLDKTDTLEDFIQNFDLKVGIEYKIEINI